MRIADAYKTIEVELPSYEGSRVVMQTVVSTGVVKQIQEGTDIEFVKGLNILFHSIKSWNFEDEQGNPLPVEMKYLEELPEKDTAFLIAKLMPEIQKKSTEKTK